MLLRTEDLLDSILGGISRGVTSVVTSGGVVEPVPIWGEAVTGGGVVVSGGGVVVSGGGVVVA